MACTPPGSSNSESISPLDFAYTHSRGGSDPCASTVVNIFMALGLFAGSALAQQGAAGPEWRSYGGDAGSTKYSPLDQINRDNLADLRVVWQWESVDGRFDLDQLREDYPN
ncbi:MAG: hypothetical protein IIB37_14770, partial [Gemmatimonadetes bacterium]|nr:hypothetical protein [Gemmatimonadota bacterium]